MHYRKMILFLLMLTMVRCEEKLPVWEQPEKLVIGVIQPYTVRSPICASNREPRDPLLINIGVVNNFDETLEGAKYIRIKLTIWLRYHPSIKRTFSFESINPNDLITIDAGQTYWIRLQWDHRENDGNYIWSTPTFAPEITIWGYQMEFKAMGTIQIFENIQSTDAEEIDFTVQYFSDDKC